MTCPADDALGPAIAELAAVLRRSTVEVHAGGSGVGSGVIWHTDGLIVTNAHVARGDSARVVLWNGHPLDGRVLARDRRRDLAAIVTSPDAPLGELTLPATIGQPTALRPGELVVALGNPLGIVGALALGVVHAVDPGRGGAARWIRADIRLAPGNSGGPLADARGRVIGINTMIAGGLGIAVPVSIVERFLEDAGLRARRAESRAA
jgi:serine protease Do